MSTPILKLFADLDEDLKNDPNGPHCKEILHKYIKEGHTDWKDYVHFNDIKYARNLVDKTERLELILLCWKAGQVSPIHNHEGQHCWAAVMQGTIEETHFHFKNTHATHGEGPLEVVDKGVYPTGEVSYIDDGIALHVLRPINDEAGITLHLYSKPIAQCSIYDFATGTITRRKSGFYTINKTIQPQDPCCTTCPGVSPSAINAVLESANNTATSNS